MITIVSLVALVLGATTRIYEGDSMRYYEYEDDDFESDEDDSDSGNDDW